MLFPRLLFCLSAPLQVIGYADQYNVKLIMPFADNWIYPDSKDQVCAAKAFSLPTLRSPDVSSICLGKQRCTGAECAALQIGNPSRPWVYYVGYTPSNLSL